MAVYYKFKSAKDYDSIPIEGQFISVLNLKERISESKHLGRGKDFDLMISNAQSNEEYVDEAAMIPKNTALLIRRVPVRLRKPIVTGLDESNIVEDKVEENLNQSSVLVGDSSMPMKYPEESDWDEFGNDLYAIPEVVPTQSSNAGMDVSPASKIDEESKIKALIETPALDWSRQDGFGGRGFGRGMGGRAMSGRGFGRGGFERKTPPAGYICFRCKVPGHFIQHCPTNGDPNYDLKKAKPPTGIPKSMLIATPDGSYALPGGAAAVLKPNEAAFEKEIEGMPSTRPVSDIPPELRCPLCKEVMKDAVLTSKCCFRSFCDKCIRDYIISKLMCVCGATNILADDLLPNKTLRETISRILESTNSSTENAGSVVHVQDMESARHVPARVPSPALSSASRDETKQTPPVAQTSDVKTGNAKEADATSQGRAANDMIRSLEKKTVEDTRQSEVTPESTSTKEPRSPESALVPEEGQEKALGAEQGKKKKKKKARVSGSAADMQWRGFQDIGAENYAGMPLGPSAYNPYWGGGVPMGFDGFMPPFGGAMPYMGYAPGPFDVPFGGMLPPDPFAAQGYMMPPLPPRDLSELGFNNMNMNKAPPMSREGFEAMKADIRRKRELERLHGREPPRDSRDSRHPGKEVGSSGADVSPKKAKPRLTSKADRPPERSSLDHERRERQREPSQPRREKSSRRHSPPPLPRPPAKRRSTDRHEEREKEKEREREKEPEREKERGRGEREKEPKREKERGRVREREREREKEKKEDDRAAAAAAAEKKHKASVFSRISFPTESEKDTKKRRTSSGSDNAGGAAVTNGVAKDSHHHHRSHRDEVSGHRSGSVLANGQKRSSYEHDSSEEEEEEDYHFKRRPSRKEREREDEGRSSRTSREQERDRDRGRDAKRR